MSYLALYRKYRSSTFDEVAGQEYVVKTLENSLKNNEISHAYLFSGPRGTGKTSVARLFAKALNCEEGFGKICNKCENCTLINEGTHPDVIEIDAASNSRVEEMRNIIERVKYSPIKGRYKVYIIDEVHMLSNSAFNALLKTLEEPPENVVFILATTEPHKVLPTIISRCQRFDFSKISEKDIKDRLLKIMKIENIICDTQSLNEIVSLSDGCMRDALSILDQLVAYTNKTIHYSDVQNVFGIVSIKEQISFLKLLFTGDLKDLLKKYHTFVDSGSDIIRLNSNLATIIKDIIIYKNTADSSLLEKITKDDAFELAQITDSKTLNSVIELMLSASNDLKMTSNVSSLYEITLLKLCSFFTSKKDETNEIQTNKQEDKIEPNVPKENASKTEVTETDFFDDYKPMEDEQIAYSDDLIISAIVKSSKEQKLRLYNSWNDLRNYITDIKYAKYVNAFLKCELFSFCDELLIVQTNFKSIVAMINSSKNNAEASELISNILGSPIKVYAVNNSESSRLQTLYYNLRQIDKLPRKENVGKLFK